MQLAAHDGMRGVRQIDDVQRVDLAEGDDVGELLDEANGVDPLAEADAAHLADHRQATVVLGEHRDRALRRGLGAAPPGRLVGGDHTEVAFVLRQ